MYLRNEHLQYIITWCVTEQLNNLCKVQALAGFLSVVAFWARHSLILFTVLPPRFSDRGTCNGLSNQISNSMLDVLG